MQLFTRYRQDTVIEKQLASLANGAGTVRSTPAVLTITRRPICSNDYDTINHRKMPEFFVGFFKTGDTNASTGWRIAIETSGPALNLRRKTPTAGRFLPSGCFEEKTQKNAYNNPYWRSWSTLWGC